MKIFRLEHKITGLGPYEHDGQIADVINKGIHNNAKIVKDLTDPLVNKIFETYNDAIFGYDCLTKIKLFVKDWSVLKKYGFIVKEYDKQPLYTSDDGQVIFRRNEMTNSKMSALYALMYPNLTVHNATVDEDIIKALRKYAVEKGLETKFDEIIQSA